MSEIGIKLGGLESEYLRINVLGRSHPDSSHYFDRNWLAVDVKVSVGAFQAKTSGLLLNGELKAFNNELKKLYKALSGKASFSTLESWLEIDIEGDGKGLLTVNCKITDSPGFAGNVLHFELNIDQTFLPPIITSLDQVISTYPIHLPPNS